jgi:hypothetical protein
LKIHANVHSATVGKTGVPTNGNISIAPTTAATKKNYKKKYAYYNKAGQRLDEPLPPKDPAAANSLEARMKKVGKKMCNHWHLGGYCEKGKFCGFQHEPKLTAAELNALRYKTRSLACKNRCCENIDCCEYPLSRHCSGIFDVHTASLSQWQSLVALFRQ